MITVDSTQKYMTNKDRFSFKQIGIIHSPHKELSKIPIQPVFCKGIEGKVILNNEIVEGLNDLDEFSHIYLFFYFNESHKTCLQVKPYLSDIKHGIFATRAPYRPNKLGMSLVRLLRIEGNILYVSGIDILDGTPLLDIKPYIKRFDSIESSKSGWLDAIQDDTAAVQGLRDFRKKIKTKL